MLHTTIDDDITLVIAVMNAVTIFIRLGTGQGDWTGCVMPNYVLTFSRAGHTIWGMALANLSFKYCAGLDILMDLFSPTSPEDRYLFGILMRDRTMRDRHTRRG
jgi:hypothetical protein